MAQNLGLREEISNECKQAKNKWFNEKCAETERMSITYKAYMNKRIRYLIGQKTYTFIGCIKFK